MVERQPEGVQEEPPRPEALVGLAVAGVAHDRVADGRHVDADLVGPAALERELEQRRGLGASARRRSTHRVGGPGRLAAGGHRHLRRGPGRSSDRRLDLAPVVGHVAGDQSQVAPLHRPRRQLVHEGAVGLGGAGHGQQPRGALVQPVHDARVGRAAHTPAVDQLGQVGEAVQQSADQGALGVARARVHDETGRLVDHGHLSSACTTSKRTPGSAATPSAPACGQARR